MRVKLDENIDVRIVGMLTQNDMDVSTVYSEQLSGVADQEIFAVIAREKRTLITLDLDFANPLRFGPAETCGTVVLRPHRAVLSDIQSMLIKALPTIKNISPNGKLLIVEPGRIRIYDPKNHD